MTRWPGDGSRRQHAWVAEAWGANTGWRVMGEKRLGPGRGPKRALLPNNCPVLLCSHHDDHLTFTFTIPFIKQMLHFTEKKKNKGPRIHCLPRILL